MFWKQMSVIGEICLKLLTPKDVLISMHSRYCFWKTFGSERVNESQKLLKSIEKYFDPTFSSFWSKLSFKKLFFIRSEILKLLVNTLTANYEYSRSNRENLQLQIQIKLSIKPWSFLMYFFFSFYDYTSNFQCSEKKDERHRPNVSEVIDFKRCDYLNA